MAESIRGGTKKLTAKEEKFSNLWFETGNKTEAYKGSYSTKNMKEETIRQKAVRLSQKGNILKKYKELSKKMEKKALWTRERAFKELEKVMIATSKDRAFNVTVSAIKELNAIADIYPKENEVDIDDPVYLAKLLKRMPKEKIEVLMNEFSKDDE